MPTNHLIKGIPDRKGMSLATLVENRSIYTFDQCELNLFETHTAAENVHLKFDHFVLTSMLMGKKVMKLYENSVFDYLPGESVILPPGESMNIDFPEAKPNNPTKCIALTLSADVIQQTIDMLNERHPKEQTWGEWEIDPSLFHLNNNEDLAETVGRIIRITKNQQGRAKELMVDLTLQEMLIRLMQTQARLLFETSLDLLKSNNSLAAAIDYMKNNLTGKIDLNKAADIACMSRSGFFKKFKEVMGETPSQHILTQRLKLAQNLLRNTRKSVSEVCFASGFENLSHFSKAFKKEVGMTPKAWQLSLSQ